MEIRIRESEVVKAAREGMDAFVELFRSHILEAIGGELNARTMSLLSPDQITLLAYMTVREEVMDGGFVQLIHNGYGPFIFLNPFAKAMRLWGIKEMTNLIYDGRRLFEAHQAELTRECTDVEFMALFEQHPEFDELDDLFVEMEEEVTEKVARYVDEHIENFATVVKD